MCVRHNGNDGATIVNQLDKVPSFVSLHSNGSGRKIKK